MYVRLCIGNTGGVTPDAAWGGSDGEGRLPTGVLSWVLREDWGSVGSWVVQHTWEHSVIPTAITVTARVGSCIGAWHSPKHLQTLSHSFYQNP